MSALTNLTGLTLYNFRTFAHKTLNLKGPVTLVTGSNGAGKTSVLEAVGYSLSAHSLSGGRPEEMIRQEQQEAFVALTLERQDQGKITATLGWSRDGQKTIRINNKIERTHKALAAYLSPWSVAQEDLQLLTGSPEIRRAFLNQNHFCHDGQSSVLWGAYKRALVQRNALIESMGTKSQIFVQWTALVHELGGEIQKWRRDFLTQLQPNFLSKLAQLEIFNNIELIYRPKICLANNSLEAVLQNASLANKEVALGHTLFGPHLDDFQINFKTMDSKRFASRGENKLLLIAIKLATLELVEEKGMLNNILLIDDLITDLDDNNLKKGLNLILGSSCQIIITSPTTKILPVFNKNFQHIEL